MLKACDNCGIGHTTSLSLLTDHFEASKYVECARKTGEQQQQQQFWWCNGRASASLDPPPSLLPNRSPGSINQTHHPLRIHRLTHQLGLSVSDQILCPPQSLLDSSPGLQLLLTWTADHQWDRMASDRREGWHFLAHRHPRIAGHHWLIDLPSLEFIA